MFFFFLFFFFLFYLLLIFVFFLRSPLKPSSSFLISPVCGTSWGPDTYTYMFELRTRYTCTKYRYKGQIPVFVQVRFSTPVHIPIIMSEGTSSHILHDSNGFALLSSTRGQEVIFIVTAMVLHCHHQRGDK